MDFWLFGASLVCGILVLYTSMYIHKEIKTPAEKRVLDAWKNLIKRPQMEFSRVLVGISSNVDLTVVGTKFFSEFNVKPGRMKKFPMINSVDEFRESFAYFFSRGVPAERFVTNPKLFDKILKAAENDVGAGKNIGGNAAIMASYISENYPNTDVTLVGPIGAQVKSLLHWNVTTQDCLKLDKDEIHVVIVYPEMHLWGNFLSPQAGRFILVQDTFSSSDALIDMFFKAATTYKPDLMIFSGVHLFEFQANILWQEKLNSVSRKLKEIAHSVPVHLEISCMVGAEFVKNVLTKVIPFVSSIGLNDQELFDLTSVGEGPYANETAGSMLQPHMALSIMQWLLEKFGQQDKEANEIYRLQRVQVHTHRYHAIAVLGDYWTNQEAALSAGALTAGRKACGISSQGGSDSSDLYELQIKAGDFLFDVELNKWYLPCVGQRNCRVGGVGLTKQSVIVGIRL